MNPSQKGEALASPLFSQTLLFDWLFNPPRKGIICSDLLLVDNQFKIQSGNNK